MATWVVAKTYKYNDRNLTNGIGSTPVYIDLMYDKDSLTTTRVKIKFVGYALNNNTKVNGYYNIYTILYNPGGGIAETNILLKKHTSSSSAYAWLTDTHQITLTKSETDPTFTLKKFWVCNCGAVYPLEMKSGTVISVDGPTNIQYSNDKNQIITYDFYELFDYGRAAWCDKTQTEDTNIFSGVFAGPCAGTACTDLTIEDLGNNTAKISGKLGNAGTGNSLTSVTLYYALNENEPTPGSASAFSKTLAKSNNSFEEFISASVDNSVVDAAKKAGVYTVKAKTRSVFAYNTADDSIVTKTINYYVAPNNVSNIALTKDSYKNNRLTLKTEWKYTWSVANKANNSSAVKGYRIRLYKNGINIPIKDRDGKQLSKLIAGSATDYYYDYSTTAAEPYITINPEVHEFKPKDTIQLGIYAYTENGETPARQLFSSTNVKSAVITVENAGIVRVKTQEDSWVEGQVYVRAYTDDGKNTEWKEAETVNVYTVDGWKESQ